MQLGVLPLGTGNDLASANSVTSSHPLCFFGGRSTRGHWSVVVLHCLLQYTGGGTKHALVSSRVSEAIHLCYPVYAYIRSPFR